MAQYDPGDFGLAADISGVTLVALLEDWAAAIHSSHSGSTRPAYLIEGAVWYDTDTDELKYYDGATDHIIAKTDGPTFSGTTSFATINTTAVNAATLTGAGATSSTLLQFNNTSGGATNIYKYWRMGSSGTIEVINSAYNNVIMSIADNGDFFALGRGTFNALTVNTRTVSFGGNFSTSAALDITSSSSGIASWSSGTLGSTAASGTGDVAMTGSPTFTGTPAAPTAAPGTNTTQIATTAFVLANGGSPGSATETSEGIVELATTAEAAAGTDTARAVTAAGVEANFDAHVLTATGSLNWGSMASGGTDDTQTITVTGAASGDAVALSVPTALNAGLVLMGMISSANTVVVRCCNYSSGTIDPTAKTIRATVFRPL